MGGIAGHAGLFSTADDLAAFAWMLLDGGRAGRTTILFAPSITEMTVPAASLASNNLDHARGLGWDLGAPLCANREQLLPVGSYGHLGFTGTMLWIDPISFTYVIVLTDRTYPNEAGDAGPLRREIITLVSEPLGTLSEDQVLEHLPGLNSFLALTARSFDSRVVTGADIIAAEGFGHHARIGLITNQTGRTDSG